MQLLKNGVVNYSVPCYSANMLKFLLGATAIMRKLEGMCHIDSGWMK